MKSIFAKLMISCKEATRLMSKQMERPLSLKEKFLLNYHNGICKGCIFFENQIKNLSQLLTNCPTDDDPSTCAKLSQEVRDKIKSKMIM